MDWPCCAIDDRQLEEQLDTWQRNLQGMWGGAEDPTASTLRPEELALTDTIQRVDGLKPQPFQDMVKVSDGSFARACGTDQQASTPLGLVTRTTSPFHPGDHHLRGAADRPRGHGCPEAQDAGAGCWRQRS